MIVIENLKHHGAPVSLEIGGVGVHGILFESEDTKAYWMSLLSGCEVPEEGQVLIERKGAFHPTAEQKKYIGYVPATLSLYEDMTVLETLNFFAEAKGVLPEKREKQIREALDLMGLQEVSCRLVANLSAANRRRVVMAQAVLGNPSLIVMDEPYVAADAEQKRDIEALLLMLGRHKPIIIGDVCAEHLSICGDVIVVTEDGVPCSKTADKAEEDEA